MFRFLYSFEHCDDCLELALMVTCVKKMFMYIEMLLKNQIGRHLHGSRVIKALLLSATFGK